MATYWQSLVPQALSVKSGSDNVNKSDDAKEVNINFNFNLTDTWFGFWDGQLPNIAHPVSILETATRNLTTTQALDGWDNGYGTISGSTVTLKLFAGKILHATLVGTLDSTGNTIAWDNGSGWCRNGSTANCTAAVVDRWLADYGGASNLLECVPTYTHKVASLNAANVWLMRQMAEVLERNRSIPVNKTMAGVLRSMADNVSNAVIDNLYVAGKGFWACQQPNGELVQVWMGWVVGSW